VGFARRACAVLAAVLVASCGGRDFPDADPPVEDPQHPCNLLTHDEVERVVGHVVDVHALIGDLSREGDVSACQWNPKLPGTDRILGLLIFSDEAEKTIDEDFQPVVGLGTKGGVLNSAQWANGSEPRLLFVHGTELVEIDLYHGDGHGASVDYETEKQLVIDLARKVDTRLK
jgi:hypothetical protein